MARGTSESNTDAIAALAEGDWNKALFSLEHAAEGEANAQLFIHWMRQAFTANGAELVKASDQLAGLGREGLKHFLEYSTAVLRDAFLIGYKLPELTRVGISKEVFDLSKFATFIHGENIYDLMQLFATAQRDISRNGNAKIVMMDLSIQITRALHRKRTAFKELES
jgi:DNA polymerase-3 subunit delta'